MSERDLNSSINDYIETEPPKNYLWSWTWIKTILCRKNKKYPFREGNTRITALFIEKYLVSLEYDVDNSMFKENQFIIEMH